MQSAFNISEIDEKFQGLFEDELIREIKDSGSYHHFLADSIVVDIGEMLGFLPMILSGSIKVLTEDEEGRELLLYYLESGETCAVTMNCCTTKAKSKIRAVADSEAGIWFVPVSKVEEWMGRYRSWRNFILETYDYRLHEMLIAVDNLAFSNMEQRLYKYLRDKALVTGSTSIHETQNEIANNLHSSRVVISRILKKLEEDGLISYKRNAIELIKL